ncbi:hypothetical protein SMD20_39835 [Nonomuraea sp. LP-02]|uniref:hypothetical protein n=1 Tax=Nonomuraea sp. LP-02 TaxID=3097960 RepID=UPI002E2FA5C5|nr:hypothetical protein [Nonomuraea sp. LP-02]MED7930431.1 hypothetical protein [Nonomuraea sp. LP-02]
MAQPDPESVVSGRPALLNWHQAAPIAPAAFVSATARKEYLLMQVSRSTLRRLGHAVVFAAARGAAAASGSALVGAVIWWITHQS